MKVSEMTDEELRVTLAKALGWTRHNESYPYERSSNGVCKRIVWRDRDGGIVASSDDFLPEWASDLNHIHEVEKTLTPAQQGQYASQLYWQVGEPDYSDHFINLQRAFAMAHMSARQRCEALVLTLGGAELRDAGGSDLPNHEGGVR